MKAEYQGMVYKDDTFTTCLHGSYKLKVANLHPNTRVIGKDAFRGSNIKKIVFPEGVKTIQKGAFYECKNLEKIVLPKSLTKIYEGAFLMCENLKTVDLSQTKLKEIDENVFYKCEKLEKVFLPEKLKKIHRNAFYETAIKEINFPDTLDFIGNNAFSNTNIKKLIIPKNVEEINERTFCGCRNLKEINLGNIKKVGHFAFSDCENLEDVALPETLLEFSSSCFDGTKIKEVFIPKNIETIWFPGRRPGNAIEKFFYEELSSKTERNLKELASLTGFEVEKKSFLDYMVDKGKSFKEIHDMCNEER